MGLNLSRQVPEYTPLIPYMCGTSHTRLTVDPAVEIEVKPSTLNSEFVKGKNRGWFAKKFIPKDTIIAEVDMNEECMMNDGLVNLEPLLQAKTSQEFYTAWKALHAGYYDAERAKQVINVRMISDVTSRMYYQTIQDVPVGGELLRVYGFTSWFFELFDVLTNHNVAGLAKFVTEYRPYAMGDPFETRVATLDQCLNMPSVDLQQYDAEMQRQPLTFVGNELKTTILFYNAIRAQ